MTEEYWVVCGNEYLGSHSNPHDAVRQALSLCQDDWRDMAVWKGKELVYIVKSGGDIIPCQESTWNLPALV